MSDFGTNVGEKFAKNTLKVFFQRAIAPDITNQDYEGEIKGGGADRLSVITFENLSLKDYTGVAMTVDKPQESEATLIVDQKKSYYFQIESFAKFSSYVEDPESSLIENAGKVLKRKVDNFILGLYGDVASGNRVGTDYTTGTVAVANSTGVVTGTGTTFTSAMVGLGFKADGHSVWYRIASQSTGTSITIEDDKDDVTSAYTGGAISAGASYTIEAATVLTVTKSTIFDYIVDMKTKLDEAEIPEDDRWLVLPAKIANLLLKSDQLQTAVDVAYEEVIRKGIVGMVAGFKVYSNEQVSGDNTTGFYCLGGHKSFITMAMAFTESGVEDFIGGFGENFKGLNCYGAKVADERRKAGTSLFAKV
tara:strand:+ start:10797 stop:11885 length:1089 start_codon:yes stop_codon:yes gene_type:complete